MGVVAPNQMDVVDLDSFDKTGPDHYGVVDFDLVTVAAPH